MTDGPVIGLVLLWLAVVAVNAYQARQVTMELLETVMETMAITRDVIGIFLMIEKLISNSQIFKFSRDSPTVS